MDKIRDLTVSDSVNLNGSKEFNHLRLVNLEEFLYGYAGIVLDYYFPPFKILADLEEQILYVNNLPNTVLCSYKPDGDVIFNLQEVREEEGARVVVYKFFSYIS